jgi:HPt (histidine-containing phosphotransfer) domain-containing protein
LSFVHRAISGQAEPPFVLFVAEAGQIGSLAELGDGELTGLLPAPCTEAVLEAALHALPLAQGAPAPVPLPAEPAGASEPEGAEAAEADERVTPIAAHPRFGSDTAPPVDSRVLASLRGLDGDFLPELVQSFRADASLLIDRLDGAAAIGDATAFAGALHALRRSAAALGGTRLCELAHSLRAVNGAELRQHGAAIMQRLSAELARLDAALIEFLPLAGRMG